MRKQIKYADSVWIAGEQQQRHKYFIVTPGKYSASTSLIKCDGLRSNPAAMNIHRTRSSSGSVRSSRAPYLRKDGERLPGGTRRLCISAFKSLLPRRESEINLIRCNETLTLADFTRRRCTKKLRSSLLVWQEPAASKKAITLLIFCLRITILSHFAEESVKES